MHYDVLFSCFLLNFTHINNYNDRSHKVVFSPSIFNTCLVYDVSKGKLLNFDPNIYMLLFPCFSKCRKEQKVKH